MREEEEEEEFCSLFEHVKTKRENIRRFLRRGFSEHEIWDAAKKVAQRGNRPYWGEDYFPLLNAFLCNAKQKSDEYTTLGETFCPYKFRTAIEREVWAFRIEELKRLLGSENVVLTTDCGDGKDLLVTQEGRQYKCNSRTDGPVFAFYNLEIKKVKKVLIEKKQIGKESFS